MNKGTAFEATPLMVDGRLIFSTPFNRVIALDPESGRELWTFDPRIDRARRFANMLINRGVAWWDGGGAAAAPCARRVFLGTLDARLIALDAATGVPCADFGVAGSVDLLAGLAPLVDAWECNVTSPPTVIGDVIVAGAILASFPLPAGLHAGPITYQLRPDGKQFLVVAPGGHVGLGSPLGDHVIAYTLP